MHAVSTNHTADYTGPYNEILQQFVQFSETRMADIVQLARQTLHVDANISTDYDIQMGQTVLQEAIQAFMSEVTQSSQNSIQDVRNQNTLVSATASTEQQSTVSRDFNRPLPNILPANWQAPLPMHVLQPSTQNSQLPSSDTVRPIRPAVSAPTTPAHISTSTFPDTINPQQEASYETTLWHNAELQYDFLGGPESFLPNDQSYVAGNLSQNELDEYHVVDGFFTNTGHSDSGRKERRLH